MSESRSVVLCLRSGEPLFDPGPDRTEKRKVDLVDSWQEDTIGVVGWGDGGWAALALAAEHPDLPRLAILATPFLDEDERPVDLNLVTAKTLLLFGSKDPATGSKHGRLWQQTLANARLEMIPSAGADILEQMWKRTLSHLAPRQTGIN